jgi:hypothetical protein
MPVWASVLITVVAAVGAGAFGAGLAVWNDRHERFRDRMIEAADEFNVAAADALVKLRDAVRAVREANDPALMKSTTELAWQAHDDALRASARVDLLFGPGCETTAAVSAFLNRLAIAQNTVRPPNLDAGGAESALVEATSDLRRFHRAAFNGIRRAAPPSATMRESVQRALRRDAMSRE